MVIYSTVFSVKDRKKSVQKHAEFKEISDNLPDGLYCITIQQVIGKRTRQQEKTWWGVLVEKFIRPALSELSGFEYSNEQTFEIIKKECLPEAYKQRLINEYKELATRLTIDGKEKLLPEFRLTSTKLTKSESIEFIDNIYAFSIEYLNLNLPELKK